MQKADNENKIVAAYGDVLVKVSGNTKNIYVPTVSDVESAWTCHN